MTVIAVPDKAEYILRTLHENGFEAYVVGGCVRDSILGKTPADWDITTSASPEQVKALFHRTIDTGIEHGTVTVMVDKEGFEVTTYRIDGIYEDNRHPMEVTFTSCLEEDLRRRDFTINAMAYSPTEGLVDHFDGLGDLENGMIRCVGNAKERFSEDALRMMRAVRFAAQLGFSIEEETADAIREMARNLIYVSAERIQAELVKLLMTPNPHLIELAYDCGITKVILPEFDRIMAQRQHSPHHYYTVGVHTIIALKNTPEDKIMRLAVLFHDMGKPDVFYTDENGKDHFRGHAAYSEKIAKNIMKRLKFDNETLHKVCSLVKNHSRYPQVSGRDIRNCVYNMGGAELFEMFLKVKRADIMAHNPDVIEKKLNYLKEVERIWHHVLDNHDCLSLKELQLTGKDLVSDGVNQGPLIGEILQMLLKEVLHYPERNQRELLLLRSREIKAVLDRPGRCRQE